MPAEPPPTSWVFPDPSEVDDDLVAVGADLEPATVLAAYRSGLFPMPLEQVPAQAMAWWSPARRGVLPLDGLRVTRSMRQSAKRFSVTVDEAFEQVLAGCADTSREGAWIDDQVTTAYRRLHELGWVHSVEVWHGTELAGGLYGVAIGGLFAGESMFHRYSDASKVALMALVDLLSDGVDGRLLDVQWATPHLMSLGVVELERVDYLATLRQALAVPLPRRWQ
ncbi:MAG: leucyl/phenylalanyl-tRNA--protein transferase [Nocardioidaceae bacterium]|nr:leucyl/phenylalanyl-tRNA--protein transferase [Nocardioidaceae bacterium]